MYHEINCILRYDKLHYIYINERYIDKNHETTTFYKTKLLDMEDAWDAGREQLGSKERMIEMRTRMGEMRKIEKMGKLEG